MPRPDRLIIALALSSPLFLGACTMDAQLASSLLDSLKQTVSDNTDADGRVSLSAQELSAAADEAGVRVVCGGNELAIASHNDEDAAADEDVLLETAESIHPVMLGYGGGGRVQRISIDIGLADELGQLPDYQGPAREAQFRKIQGRYPQMQHARPIPVKGGEGKEIVFGDFCGCDPSAQGRPAMPPRPAKHAARPGMFAMPGMYATKPGMYGGSEKPFMHDGPPGAPMPEHHHAHAEHGDMLHYGDGPGDERMGPVMFTRPMAARPAHPGQPGARSSGGFAWAGTPIDGFKNAKGQPCQLMAKADEADEAADDEGED